MTTWHWFSRLVPGNTSSSEELRYVVQNIFVAKVTTTSIVSLSLPGLVLSGEQFSSKLNLIKVAENRLKGFPMTRNPSRKKKKRLHWPHFWFLRLWMQGHFFFLSFSDPSAIWACALRLEPKAKYEGVQKVMQHILFSANNEYRSMKLCTS